MIATAFKTATTTYRLSWEFIQGERCRKTLPKSVTVNAGQSVTDAVEAKLRRMGFGCSVCQNISGNLQAVFGSTVPGGFFSEHHYHFTATA